MAKRTETENCLRMDPSDTFCEICLGDYYFNGIICSEDALVDVIIKETDMFGVMTN